MFDIFISVTSLTLRPQLYIVSIIVWFLNPNFFEKAQLMILSISSVERTKGIFESIFG